jgi:hypothetical protein
VTFWRYVAPSGTAPKLSVLGRIVAEVTGDVPEAFATTDTTGVEPLALLVNVRTPVTEPEFCGEKEIVTIWLVPAANVSGKDGPTIAKPLPLTVAAVTTVLPVPGFDIVIVCVAVAPTFTLPKNKVVGVTLSDPEVDVVVEPFAVKDSVVMGFDAFDVNETLPVILPLAVGLKEMFND